MLRPSLRRRRRRMVAGLALAGLAWSGGLVSSTARAQQPPVARADYVAAPSGDAASNAFEPAPSSERKPTAGNKGLLKWLGRNKAGRSTVDPAVKPSRNPVGSTALVPTTPAPSATIPTFAPEGFPAPAGGMSNYYPGAVETPSAPAEVTPADAAPEAETAGAIPTQPGPGSGPMISGEPMPIGVMSNVHSIAGPSGMPMHAGRPGMPMHGGHPASMGMTPEMAMRMQMQMQHQRQMQMQMQMHPNMGMPMGGPGMGMPMGGAGIPAAPTYITSPEGGPRILSSLLGLPRWESAGSKMRRAELEQRRQEVIYRENLRQMSQLPTGAVYNSR